MKLNTNDIAFLNKNLPGEETKIASVVNSFEHLMKTTMPILQKKNTNKQKTSPETRKKGGNNFQLIL